MKSTPAWLWCAKRLRNLRRAWRSSPAGVAISFLIAAALLALVVMVFVLPHTTNAGVDELLAPAVQLGLGIGVAWVAYVGWRQRQEQLVSERFTKAVEMLGDERIAVRIGGVQALGMLLRDTPARQPEVVEILCAFVRERSQALSDDEGPGEDITTAAFEIGRRADPSDDRWAKVGLAQANLSGAQLARANLSGAILSGANLSGAYLSGVNLSGALLWGANLSGASFGTADLSGALLVDAYLMDAYLSGANLADTNLFRAVLSGADLSGALLSGANLSGADLSGADLSEANLSGATFSQGQVETATVIGVDLRALADEGVIKVGDEPPRRFMPETEPEGDQQG